jgi:predicted membrane-bound spermidine synthase
MPLDWSLIANVASVVGTVGGLLFVWWRVRPYQASIPSFGGLWGFALAKKKPFDLPHGP